VLGGQLGGKQVSFKFAFKCTVIITILGGRLFQIFGAATENARDAIALYRTYMSLGCLH